TSVTAAKGRIEMRTTWKLLVALVAISALALMAATSLAAANASAVYACVKVKPNGQEDVRVGVPESAVAGLSNAGFTCVATVGDDETEDPGDREAGNGDAETEHPGNEDPGNSEPTQASASSLEVFVPQESRS